jgi:hypothetical protein
MPNPANFARLAGAIRELPLPFIKPPNSDLGRDQQALSKQTVNVNDCLADIKRKTNGAKGQRAARGEAQ